MEGCTYTHIYAHIHVSGGGQNEIDDLINYGTFSFQKNEVRQVYQHTNGGESGLPMMHEGYWWCTLVKVGMGCH